MAFIPSLKDIHMLLHPLHSFFSLLPHCSPTHYLLLLLLLFLLPLEAMKETIRCCISCILPCGSLDVIRIVHANGRVEEITRSISAAEVMQLYPKHVLRRPPSTSGEDNGMVPPNAELQRGKIYFLTPVFARPEKPKKMRRRRREVVRQGVTSDRASLLMSNQYLSEILSEKASTHRDRRRGRVGIWRPHLESISEISTDL